MPKQSDNGQTVKEKIVYVERKRRGCMMPLLGIVVLAIMGGGIYAATNPNKSGSGGTAKMNQPISVGSWKITVEKTELVPEIIWSDFGNKQAATGQYLKVYMTTENITDKTDSPKSFDYKVRDSKGAEYATCGELACFAYPEREQRISLNKDTPPRTSSKVMVIFDVAKDASGLTLEVEGGKAKITLDK